MDVPREKQVQEQCSFTLMGVKGNSTDSHGTARSFWHLNTQEGLAPGESLF